MTPCTRPLYWGLYVGLWWSLHPQLYTHTHAHQVMDHIDWTHITHTHHIPVAAQPHFWAAPLPWQGSGSAPPTGNLSCWAHCFLTHRCCACQNSSLTEGAVHVWAGIEGTKCTFTGLRETKEATHKKRANSGQAKRANKGKNNSQHTTQAPHKHRISTTQAPHKHSKSTHPQGGDHCVP